MGEELQDTLGAVREGDQHDSGRDSGLDGLKEGAFEVGQQRDSGVECGGCIERKVSSGSGRWRRALGEVFEAVFAKRSGDAFGLLAPGGKMASDFDLAATATQLFPLVVHAVT